MNKNPKIENLKPFVKGQVTNPQGRPKKVFNHAKDFGYSKDDVIDCFKLYIAKTYNELAEIQKSDDITILEMVVINSLIRDIKDGKIDNLEKILNRAIGLPRAESTQTNINVEVAEVTDDMQNELLNTLKRMLD
jgi:hypothetical protein